MTSITVGGFTPTIMCPDCIPLRHPEEEGTNTFPPEICQVLELNPNEEITDQNYSNAKMMPVAERTEKQLPNKVKHPETFTVKKI